LIENDIDFLSHENKVDSTKNITLTVANVDELLLLKMQDFVKKIYSIFGNNGVMRIDFILNQKDNELYFLEVNTIPGMSPQSIFPKMLVAVGMTFSHFLTRTICEGIENNPSQAL
jgi:D-alanine-D-alanine ligase